MVAVGFLVISCLVTCVSAQAGEKIIRPQVSFNYALSGVDWNGTCETGKRQSPINIDPEDDTILELEKSRSPRLEFGTGKNVTVYNTGHTIQVQWVTDIPSNASIRLGSFLGQPNATGSVASLDNPGVMLGDADSRLTLKPLQWHVHTPSEHTINGKFSAMEAHLVTAIQGTGNFSFCPPTGCLAVFGVLYDLVRNLSEPDPFLSQYFDNLPRKVGLKNGNNLRTPLVFKDFFPPSSEFISYSGSLTTPPCSENVLWTVMTTPRKMSIGQLAQLQLALGTTDVEEECYKVYEGSKLGSSIPVVSEQSSDNAVEFVLCAEQGERTNDRFPQPLNNRTVWEFKGAVTSA